MLGLAVAIAIGYGIFAAGIRIDLRRFFTYTGVVLIFVSAGLVAFSIHAFGEAGLIVNQGAVFDLGGVLPQTARSGRCWPGSLAIAQAPTPLELIGYFGYLIPVLILFVWGGRKPAPVASGPTGASGGRRPDRRRDADRSSGEQRRAPDRVRAVRAGQREEVAAADRLDVLLERLARRGGSGR